MQATFSTVEETIARLRDENARLRALLKEFAFQKTEDEMSDEEFESADVWGAYDAFVRHSREALK